MARVRAPRPSLMTAALAALALIGWAPARVATDQALGYFEASGDVGSPSHHRLHLVRRGQRRPTPSSARGTNMWADARRVPVRVAQADRRLHRPDARRISSARASIRTARSAGSSARASTPTRPTSTPRVHGDGLTSLQFRKAAGGVTEQMQSTVDRRRRHSARAQGRTLHHVGRALRRAVHAHRD